MKKIFAILFIIFISFLACFANNQAQFCSDMEKVIEHILNDKVTFKHTTYRQMLDDLNLEADNIYKLYLADKSNYKIYYERLNEISGTVSMYSDSICEDMKDTMGKYNIEINPSTECDIEIYNKYIKNSDIKNAKGLKDLIDYHEASFQRIYGYTEEIFRKNLKD